MLGLTLDGVHKDGQHLVFKDADGRRYQVALDDALRAAARRDRARLGQIQIEIDGGLRPRDVQAMIRRGATSAEVADRTGWSLDKIAKYEGPILAERAYVAGLAREVPVSARAMSRGATAPELGERVDSRLATRDVVVSTSDWDAWQDPTAGDWRVAVSFTAGERRRTATWRFDLGARRLTPLDDEARWLFADEAPEDGATARPAHPPYDLEAEGGLAPVVTTRRLAHETEAPVDLMVAMRARSAVRDRRTGPRPSRSAPGALPPGMDLPEDALPLEVVRYDPELDGLPPAAHARPERTLDLSEVREVLEPTRTASTAKASTKGRPSVPSWDDIVFGAKPRSQADRSGSA